MKAAEELDAAPKEEFLKNVGHLDNSEPCVEVFRHMPTMRRHDGIVGDPAPGALPTGLEGTPSHDDVQDDDDDDDDDDDVWTGAFSPFRPHAHKL